MLFNIDNFRLETIDPQKLYLDLVGKKMTIFHIKKPNL